MKLTRFAALFTFISFTVAIPVAEVPSAVAARSAKEVRAPAAVPATTFAKRDFETAALGERQLGSLINSLVPLISGIPVVGPLLTTVLSLVGSSVPLRDLQSGTKSIHDLSNETGVSVDDLKELFAHLPAGTIPGVVSKRQIALPGINISGLLNGLLPYLSTIPIVGTLISSLLRDNTLRDLQTGAKTIEDLARETGASVDNIKQVLSLLPPGTIAGI